MPNQAKCVLSIRSARCSAMSILTIGTLFFLVASVYFGVRAAQFIALVSHDPVFYWQNGYPILIGIWSDVTGVIGICATNPRRSRDKCLTATFGIFSLILIGTKSYAIWDFQPYLKTSIKALSVGACGDFEIWQNCYFNVSLYGSFIFLAALVELHSIWCVICCIGSFVCVTDVQPGAQDGEQQVPQPITTEGTMMNENPPPYNPALQASTDNLQADNGPPMYQGSVPVQASAPMAYDSGPPLYPNLQDNVEGIQGNAIPMTQATSGEKTGI